MSDTPIMELDVSLRRGAFDLHARARVHGPVTGLFGRSGAGKSTLLHAICGLVRPDAGRIVVNGVALYDHDRGVNLPPHQRDVGMVFQDARLFPHLSVLGNLQYGLKRIGRSHRHFDLDEIVDLLELAPLIARRTAGLSGGERQRVAIARALLTSPQLLLLDEPLAGVDVRMRGQVLPFLQRVRDRLGIPMVYVSHDLRELLRITDQVLVMDRGRVVRHGTVPDLAG